MEKRHASTYGFTLIELLIVVAIIAILAAIAVPNFLEAQVRAKVSRAHADMRSVATAIEAYAVDSNRAPMAPDELDYVTGVTGHNDRDSMARLTTPLAYITTMVNDPFADKGSFTLSGKLISPAGTPFQSKYFNWGAGMTGMELTCNGRGYTWGLGSRGPSRDAYEPEHPLTTLTIPTILTNANPLYLYDPSNGSVSIGWIMRTNKGVTSGGDWAK